MPSLNLSILDRPFSVVVLSVLAVGSGLVVLYPALAMCELLLTHWNEDWSKIPAEIWRPTYLAALMIVPCSIILISCGLAMFLTKAWGWIGVLGVILSPFPSAVGIQLSGIDFPTIEFFSISSSLILLLLFLVLFSPSVREYFRLFNSRLLKSVVMAWIVAIVIAVTQVYAIGELVGTRG